MPGVHREVLQANLLRGSAGGRSRGFRRWLWAAASNNVYPLNTRRKHWRSLPPAEQDYWLQGALRVSVSASNTFTTEWLLKECIKLSHDIRVSSLRPDWLKTMHLLAFDTALYSQTLYMPEIALQALAPKYLRERADAFLAWRESFWQWTTTASVTRELFREVVLSLRMPEDQQLMNRALALALELLDVEGFRWVQDLGGQDLVAVLARVPNWSGVEGWGRAPLVNEFLEILQVGLPLHPSTPCWKFVRDHQHVIKDPEARRLLRNFDGSAGPPVSILGEKGSHPARFWYSELVEMAGEWWGLTALITDGHLTIKKGCEPSLTGRYLLITSRLHCDLQVVVALRAALLARNVLKSVQMVRGLRAVAAEFVLV